MAVGSHFMTFRYSEQNPDVAGNNWHELYLQLRSQLRAEGCFKPAAFSAAINMTGTLLLLIACYALLLTDPSWSSRILLLILVAFASVQAGFIAHYAGHGAITRDKRRVAAIGHFFMTFLTGVIFTHFQHNHTRHHPNCNCRVRDPDLQTSVFLLYPGDTTSKHWAAKYISKHQHVLLWLLVSLQGFTLKLDSLQTISSLGKAAKLEWFLLFLHILAWLILPMVIIGPSVAIVNYIALTWFLGPYTGSVFTVNHLGLPTFTPKESVQYMERQLLSTRNLGDSRWSDFYFGGLNNHIEHHLFPSMSKSALRRARPIVRQFCQQNGLPYNETSWSDAISGVYNSLKSLSYDRTTTQ